LRRGGRVLVVYFFFFSSRRRHTRWPRDWSSDVCSSDLPYDALLDEYEPGATAAELTRVFAALRDDLVPLVQAILNSGKKAPHDRSEERRVGKECRSRWAAEP